MAKIYCSSCDGTGQWKYGDPEYKEECSVCDGTGVDTEWRDEIICPYCAEVISSDDLHESTTIDCYVCGKEIRLEIEYSPSYSTYRT